MLRLEYHALMAGILMMCGTFTLFLASMVQNMAPPALLSVLQFSGAATFLLGSNVLLGTVIIRLYLCDGRAWYHPMILAAAFWTVFGLCALVALVSMFAGVIPRR